MPVLNWCLEQLLEVRGLEAIHCCVAPELVPQTKKLLTRSEIGITEIPAKVNKTDQDVTRWLHTEGPARTASRVLLIVPTVPFMPAAKIEACVDAVNRGKHSLAMPARTTKVVMDFSKSFVKALPSVISSVRAMRTDLSEHTLHTVEVGLIESLDVRDADNLQLVQAMVSAGTV
jgi:hypothetical protein